MTEFYKFICILLTILAISQCYAQSSGEDDRLSQFYKRIQKSDARYCPDRTKILPACTECIPGLQKGSGSSTCNEFIAPSKEIRDEIKKLTDERYGDKPVADRPFGLYPCKIKSICYILYYLLLMRTILYFILLTSVDLEKPDFMSRQITFGKLMSTPSTSHPLRNIMDIGAYYNPINLFLSPSVCPESVIIVEPILDPLSVIVPCAQPTDATAAGGAKETHIMFLPITFRYYMTISNILPKPETVVCIGCDSHYGPNRKMLETAFERPYTLYIEYPSEYVHNTPFKKMNGDGKGEELTFIRKFQPRTNETQYTKRVMKIIEYSRV